jgi:probable rRNA maturation factor
LSIKIYYEKEDFRLKGCRKFLKILKAVIESERKIEGDLCLIFTNDKKIRELNVKYLNHNYFTDVISFDNSDENSISGEIYVSVDTVKINALNYNVSFNEEIIRVLVHGILHLCGYSDDNIRNKRRMRELEDVWIFKYLELK